MADREAAALTETGTPERLAFWHSYAQDDGHWAPTFQGLLENPSGKRKNSNYVTHGVHRYKGKFYPQLAKSLMNLSESLTDDDAVVFDPFCGSGTVLLEAALNGYDAFGIDCNPLAVHITRTKVGILETDAVELLNRSEQIIENLDSRLKAPNVLWGEFAPSTHEELRSWFAPEVLRKLSVILNEIRKSPNEAICRFHEVIVSDLIREVSQQEPRDLRTRRRKEPIDDAEVAELFTQGLRKAVDKISLYALIGEASKPARGQACPILGSSADSDSYHALDRPSRRISCVVSSPPYATALPYIDTDRLSLAAVYGLDRKQRQSIEKQLIGSRETTKRETRTQEEIITEGHSALPDSTNRFLQELLDTVRNDPGAGFRKRQTPTVLNKYFINVSNVMTQLRHRLQPEADLWFVLGDSTTTIGGPKRTIPTVQEFQAIAEHNGMRHIESIPITVTREDLAHNRHNITENTIIHMRA